MINWKSYITLQNKANGEKDNDFQGLLTLTFRTAGNIFIKM